MKSDDEKLAWLSNRYHIDIVDLRHQYEHLIGELRSRGDPDLSSDEILRHFAMCVLMARFGDQGDDEIARFMDLRLWQKVYHIFLAFDLHIRIHQSTDPKVDYLVSMLYNQADIPEITAMLAVLNLTVINIEHHNGFTYYALTRKECDHS